MQVPATPFQILLFYSYVTVDASHDLADRIRTTAEKLGLTGRIIVAEEGINATVEGSMEATETFASFIEQIQIFRGIQIKRSPGTGHAFPGLTVKVRKEIVGTGFSQEEADPRVRTAPRLTPEALRAWYESSKDFVVLDMRNNYEYASGHFKESIHPNISASRHLPLALDKLAPLKQKTVVTVCTGGVRCEKMSAYLMSQGFQDVYQLDGGIHSYMEKYPGKDFQGTLYTFDQRVTMDFGGEREIVGTCMHCGIACERYVDCAEDTCHLHFLACSACSDAAGNAYCSRECKDGTVLNNPGS